MGNSLKSENCDYGPNSGKKKSEPLWTWGTYVVVNGKTLIRFTQLPKLITVSPSFRERLLSIKVQQCNIIIDPLHDMFEYEPRKKPVRTQSWKSFHTIGRRKDTDSQSDIERRKEEKIRALAYQMKSEALRDLAKYVKHAKHPLNEQNTILLLSMIQRNLFYPIVDAGSSKIPTQKKDGNRCYSKVRGFQDTIDTNLNKDGFGAFGKPVDREINREHMEMVYMVLLRLVDRGPEETIAQDTFLTLLKKRRYAFLRQLLQRLDSPCKRERDLAFVVILVLWSNLPLPNIIYTAPVTTNPISTCLEKKEKMPNSAIATNIRYRILLEIQYRLLLFLEYDQHDFGRNKVASVLDIPYKGVTELLHLHLLLRFKYFSLSKTRLLKHMSHNDLLKDSKGANLLPIFLRQIYPAILSSSPRSSPRSSPVSISPSTLPTPPTFRSTSPSKPIPISATSSSSILPTLDSPKANSISTSNLSLRPCSLKTAGKSDSQLSLPSPTSDSMIQASSEINYTELASLDKRFQTHIMFSLLKSNIVYVCRFKSKLSDVLIAHITITPDLKLLPVFIRSISRYWPLQSPVKQKILLDMVSEVLNALTASGSDSMVLRRETCFKALSQSNVIVPFWRKVIVSGVESSNLSVARHTVLFLNSSIMRTITIQNKEHLLPIMYPAMFCAYRWHPHQFVRDITREVLVAIRDANSEFYFSVREEAMDKMKTSEKDEEMRKMPRIKSWQNLTSMYHNESIIRTRFKTPPEVFEDNTSELVDIALRKAKMKRVQSAPVFANDILKRVNYSSNNLCEMFEMDDGEMDDGEMDDGGMDENNATDEDKKDDEYKATLLQIQKLSHVFGTQNPEQRKAKPEIPFGTRKDSSTGLIERESQGIELLN